MNRAIRRFVGSLNGPNKYLFFLGLLLICVVCLCLGIYAQFFYKYSDTDMFMIGINVGSQKTAEEISMHDVLLYKTNAAVIEFEKEWLKSDTDTESVLEIKEDTLVTLIVKTKKGYQLIINSILT